jgi:hypothetical protein
MTEAFSFSVVIMLRMDERVQRMAGLFVREGMSRCPY